MSKILVVDLEATCSNDGTITLDQAEVIEIGAVMVGIDNDKPRMLTQFQSFVRPTSNAKLHPFCTQLTSITQEQVDAAPLFAAVYPVFVNWVGESIDDCIFASWGNWDHEQLAKECGENQLRFDFHRHVSIPNAARRLLGMGSKFRLMRRFGIKQEGRWHRGIDDARCYAQIVVKMLENGWLASAGAQGIV